MEYNERFDAITKAEDTEAAQFFEQAIQYERDRVARFEETSNASCDVLVQVANEIKDVTDGEIMQWRQKYEADCQRLEDDLLAAKARERFSLKGQLESRRRKREADLCAAGISSAEAASQAALELGSEEMSAIADFELKVNEETTLLSEKLRVDGQEKEKGIIQFKFKEACDAARDAELERDAAQRKLEALRQQQIEETAKLEQEMTSNRRANETKLKARLAEKREAALRELEVRKASEDEKARMLQLLEEQELLSLVEQQKQRENEETAFREEQRKAHTAILLNVERDAKEKELEAIAQAAREAALLSLKDIQDRSESEANHRNLQRLREQHAKEDERLREQSNAQKALGQGKLGDRLALKRAAREKEFAVREAQALKELADKKAQELTDREIGRAAKVIWSEKLSKSMSKARAMGLSDAEFEDFCLQQVVALVPQKQLYEVIEKIVHPRHSRAMAELLQSNFNDRIRELKAAVQSVIDEKAIKRFDLIESMAAAGEDEERVRLQLQSFDEDYSAKQLVAEADVAARLEPLHMEEQIAMRQTQMEDIGRLALLYSDPNAISVLHESAKSQADALEEYRARIENEKKAREEKLRLERRELEEKLHLEHETEVNRLKDELQQEFSKTEAAFEHEKKALMERKAAMEKQQQNEMGALDNREKERIRSAFEREHVASLAALEKDKNAQKQKLQSRLANKRQLKATKELSARAEKPPNSPSMASRMWTQLASRRLSLRRMKSTDVQAALSNQPAEAVRRKSIQSLKTLKDAVTTAAGLTSQSAAPNPQLSVAIAQIEVKLARIETVINAIAMSNTSQSQSAPLPSAIISGAYRDESEPPAGQLLQVILDESADLVVQEATRLAFGRRLAMMVGLKDLTIRAAVSLPPPTVTDNAFAHSYMIDPSSGVLFVHKDKLSSSGDFGLLLLHAFSHIKV